jgi:hypothetical protein
MWESANEALREATRRVVLDVAAFLPGLLAFLVAVFISLIAASVISSLLRRLFKRLDFDARVDQWGFAPWAEWTRSKSPAKTVCRVCYWAVLLTGLLIGLSAIQANLISRMVYGLFEYLPHVVAAVLILIFGSFAARFLAHGVLISAVNMQIRSARLLSLGVKWLVFVLAGTMALDHLRIGGNIVPLAFAILFGGIVLALALAVGLGSKDEVSRTWQRSHEKELDPEETIHHL